MFHIKFKVLLCMSCFIYLHYIEKASGRPLKSSKGLGDQKNIGMRLFRLPNMQTTPRSEYKEEITTSTTTSTTTTIKTAIATDSNNFYGKGLHLADEVAANDSDIAEEAAVSVEPVYRQQDYNSFTELTISLPNNIWAVSYGDVWRDTRFVHPGRDPTVPRIFLDSGAVGNYKQTEPYPTVCRSARTIYNDGAKLEYMPRLLSQYTNDIRLVNLGFRRELYADGNSEECHQKEMTDWTLFQECTLRRHQRMEYLIPGYPGFPF